MIKITALTLLFLFSASMAHAAEAELRIEAVVVRATVIEDEAGVLCIDAPGAQHPWNGNAYPECSEGVLDPMLPPGEMVSVVITDDGTMNVM